MRWRKVKKIVNDGSLRDPHGITFVLTLGEALVVVQTGLPSRFLGEAP